MREHTNLKYAVREGTDIIITATVHRVWPAEARGSLNMLRMEVTDGHTTLPLVMFGNAASTKCRPGQRLRAGPVYWSEQWENFSLRRGGTVAVT